MDVAEATHRVRRHYVEMPSLRLTQAQARLLFGLTDEACVSILSALVQQGWLARSPDGMYVRPQALQSQPIGMAHVRYEGQRRRSSS
jgi:hypothetical protein